LILSMQTHSLQGMWKISLNSFQGDLKLIEIFRIQSTR